jgi:hypothetical protein
MDHIVRKLKYTQIQVRIVTIKPYLNGANECETDVHLVKLLRNKQK